MSVTRNISEIKDNSHYIARTEGTYQINAATATADVVSLNGITGIGGLSWQRAAQPGDTMMIRRNGELAPVVYEDNGVDGNFTLIDGQNLYDQNAWTTISSSTITLDGTVDTSINNPYEDIKNEIQALKDEIENLKMLLLEN